MESTYVSAIYGTTIIASFLLFYYYLFPSTFKPNHKLPPQASGRPILGHLHLIGGGGSSGRSAHINLGALADQHGPIFTVRFGMRRLLVVSSWKIAKEMFTTSDVAISSRPKFRAFDHLSYNYAMFAFTPYGSYWRDTRKLTYMELLSGRQVELLSNVGVAEVMQSIKELHRHWEEKKDGSGRVLVDMRTWFENLNLNAILRMVVGKRLCSGGGGGDDADDIWCREVMRDFFVLMGTVVAGDALPWLGWLDVGGYEKKMKETAKKLDGIMGKWLEEHRGKEDSGKDEKPRDFMDVMLSVVRGSDHLGGEYSYDDDTIIKATCQLTILGSTETSSTMLTWALSLLLNNPNVLIKAQEELDKHVGRERRVNLSDIRNLVYLQAIVKETLRLYPAAPMGGPRVFAQDCNVAGYHIPKGTWLLVNLWKLHRDPEVWQDDPLEFKPERFFTPTHKNMDIKGQDFEFLPFGAGRRMCPGFNLGMHIFKMVLANVLQAFQVTTVCDETVDMTESAGLTNVKATPLEILVAPRLPHDLY